MQISAAGRAGISLHTVGTDTPCFPDEFCRAAPHLAAPLRSAAPEQIRALTGHAVPTPAVDHAVPATDRPRHSGPRSAAQCRPPIGAASTTAASVPAAEMLAAPEEHAPEEPVAPTAHVPEGPATPSALLRSHMLTRCSFELCGFLVICFVLSRIIGSRLVFDSGSTASRASTSPSAPCGRGL